MSMQDFLDYVAKKRKDSQNLENAFYAQQIDRMKMDNPNLQGPKLPPPPTPEESAYIGKLVNSVAASSPIPLPGNINPFGRLKSLFQKASPELEEVRAINPDLYRLQKYGEITPKMKEAASQLGDQQQTSTIKQAVDEEMRKQNHPAQGSDEDTAPINLLRETE